MVAGLEHILHLFAHERCADGQTAAQTLGGGDDVGADAEMLVGIELARAAIAGLNLVDHQGDVIVGAELCGGPDEFGGQGIDTALALNALEQDARGIQIGHGLGQRLDVVGLHMGKAGGQRGEILVEMILAGGGQGGQGAAMEGAEEGDDGVAVLALLRGGILTGHLDGALVAFGAGVGEEHLLHAGLFAQELGQLGAGLGVVEVGNVLQLHGLLGNGLGPGLVTEAEAGDTDAGA